MNVFTGCEKSRAVADSFEARGHTAWSCDIEPSYQPHPRHIQGDLFKTLMFRPAGGIQLAILFPECRNLCSSGQHRTGKPGQRTQADVDDAVNFFMACVEIAESMPAACIENSIGIMSSRYRKPDQIIQPYQFGEDASKATCLWLFGKLKSMLLTPTKYVTPRLVCGRCSMVTNSFDNIQLGPIYTCPGCRQRALPRWSNQTDSGQNRLPPSADRSAKRADFYPGIAKAMADQWSNL